MRLERVKEHETDPVHTRVVGAHATANAQLVQKSGGPLCRVRRWPPKRLRYSMLTR